MPAVSCVLYVKSSLSVFQEGSAPLEIRVVDWQGFADPFLLSDHFTVNRAMRSSNMGFPPEDGLVLTNALCNGHIEPGGVLR